MIERNQVTAGLPSLDPGLRGAITKARIGVERNRQLIKDDIGRESATVAPDGDLNVTDRDQQLGTPLSCAEIKRRLLLANPNFHFEISLHDATKTGIYVIWNVNGKPEKRFICGMMTGISPERSIRTPKETRVPHPDNPGEWVTVQTMESEIRGWRTVLGILLRSQVIRQDQVDLLFPMSDGKSKNWQSITT